MPETPIEKLMGWLTREEEEFGLTGAIERSIDPEACRRMLAEELRYEPSEAQVELMHEAGRLRYAQLPEIGVATRAIELPHWKGVGYTDIPTGRYIKFTEVEERLRAVGLY